MLRRAQAHAQPGVADEEGHPKMLVTILIVEVADSIMKRKQRQPQAKHDEGVGGDGHAQLLYGSAFK